jgi:hypothetical protein
VDRPDGTSSDMGHVESCIGPFGDGVSVDARCTVSPNLPPAQKSFNGSSVRLFGDSANMETR